MAVFPVPSEQMMMFLGMRSALVVLSALLRSSQPSTVDPKGQCLKGHVRTSCHARRALTLGFAVCSYIHHPVIDGDRHRKQIRKHTDRVVLAPGEVRE